MKAVISIAGGTAFLYFRLQNQEDVAKERAILYNTYNK